MWWTTASGVGPLRAAGSCPSPALAGLVLVLVACVSCAGSEGSARSEQGTRSPTPSPAEETPPPASNELPAHTIQTRLAPPHITRTQPSPLQAVADLYVAPVAAGAGDGSSPANAAGFAELKMLIGSAPPGTVIELAADRGPYPVEEAITIDGGGEPGSPITVRGPLDGDRAILLGDRDDPYRPDGNPGPVVFRLAAGADHLVFARLHCERAGNGCFHVVGGITDLTIHDVTARNVRRFFENVGGKEGNDATIEGLTLSKVEVVGFSKGAIRIGHDSHDMLIVDVVGDSQLQDGDNFAMGVHLIDTVHDVRIERVSMSNALDTIHPYWNGDGFTAEAGVHDVHFVDTRAENNSDAGYDLKSSATLLENVAAEGNKRNFRFWGQGVVMTGCDGVGPVQRGGTGSQIHVQVLEDATVSIQSCRFFDEDPATIVFSVEDTSSLVLSSVDVEHDSSGVLTAVAPGAHLIQEDVEVSTQ